MSVPTPAPPIVLDACALLAWLRMEPGGQIVRQALREHRGSFCAHAANLCEVYYGFTREPGTRRQSAPCGSSPTPASWRGRTWTRLSGRTQAA